MEIITYRNKQINESDVNTIKQIIAENTGKSRYFISKEVCRVWNWRQSNGMLKDMVCRSLLLILERKGLIKQPPPKRINNNPLANRKKPEPINIDQNPINTTVKELSPIELIPVRRTPHEKLFNGLINQYHYLGYTNPIGEHIKYMAFANQRPLACLIWGSAPWYIGDRDRFIEWTSEIRKKNLHLIATGTRFLILPWVKVHNLASHLLSLNRKRLAQDWQGLYNHPIHLIETFVDTEKYRGISYQAAGWTYVGETTGIGKLSKTRKQVLSKKAIYVYPLVKNFRRLLNEYAE